MRARKYSLSKCAPSVHELLAALIIDHPRNRVEESSTLGVTRSS